MRLHGVGVRTLGSLRSVCVRHVTGSASLQLQLIPTTRQAIKLFPVDERTLRYGKDPSEKTPLADHTSIRARAYQAPVPR